MKDFKAFREDMEKDRELAEKIQKEFKAIGEAGDVTSDREAMIKAAKAFGYDLTVSDLEKFEAENRELDDEELKAVSGGEKTFRFCSGNFETSDWW